MVLLLCQGLFREPAFTAWVSKPCIIMVCYDVSGVVHAAADHSSEWGVTMLMVMTDILIGD